MKRNPLTIYQGLPKQVYVLAFATLVNGIGVFVYPFLTLYLTSRLGYSATKAGLFLMYASMLYIPGSALGSKLADTIGRKPVMVISQLCMAFFYALCGFFDGTTTVPILVFCALFFDGVTDPAREALKTDITNFENRQLSFSFIYLVHNLGYAIGPLLGGILFTRAPRWLFWGNAIAQIIATFPIIISIKETKPSKETIELSKKSSSTDKAEEGNIFKALMTRPNILLFAVAMTFFSFAYKGVIFGLPLFTTDLFGIEKGSMLYGKIFTLNAIVVVLCNPLLVSITKNKPPLPCVFIGGILFTLGFVSMGFAKGPLWLYICCFIYTCGEILWATNSQYYVANNTPMSHRARFNAVLPIIEGAGQCFAPMVCGNVIDSFGIFWLWPFCALIVFIGAFMLLFLHKNDKPKTTQPQ